MKKIILLITLLASSVIAAADSTPYVSGDVGLVGIRGSDNANNNIFAYGGELGTVGKLAVGTLWNGTNPNFKYGAEVGTSMYSSSTPLPLFYAADYTGYNLSLLGVAKYEFHFGLVLLGKAGVALVHQRAHYYEPSYTLTNENGNTTYVPEVDHGHVSGNKLAPEVALGIGYKFNPRWETDLTVDTVFAGSGPATITSNPVSQTNTATLGLTYHFA